MCKQVTFNLATHMLLGYNLIRVTYVFNASTASKRAISTPNTVHGLHRHGYILGKTIGTGAYRKLKAATCTTSKSKRRDIAVKIINKKKSPKDILTKFLPREIETLKAIEHENVVQLYEVIEAEDAIYLMMEYVEGGDLLDFINSKHYLSERLARNLFTDLLKAVEKCHSVNVVHRDLKCENLLLTPKNKLKLTDFGFARKFDGTKLETYCGSYAYAAPEVILGEPYIGEPVDVWSMGVILYAMVSGKLPFKDSDVRTLLSEISHRMVFSSRLSEEIKDLIRRMLTFKASERVTIDEIKKHDWMMLPISSMTIKALNQSTKPTVAVAKPATTEQPQKTSSKADGLDLSNKPAVSEPPKGPTVEGAVPAFKGPADDGGMKQAEVPG